MRSTCALLAMVVFGCGSSQTERELTAAIAPADSITVVSGDTLSLVAEVSVEDAELRWFAESRSAPGVDCSAVLDLEGVSSPEVEAVIPLRFDEVRCADELEVGFEATFGEQRAEARVRVSIGAPVGLGEVWSEVSGNPILTQGTCPTWECLSHADPTIARGGDGSLRLWFSAGGDLGEFPVIGHAREQEDGGLVLDPGDGPVLAPPQSGLPWDHKRETVSVLRDPRSGSWNMAYLGYATSYFDDPAIGWVQSDDPDGTQWSHAPAPIYTPTRPGGWDESFLTSPAPVMGSDGVLRIYFAGASSSVAGGRIGVLTRTSDGDSWEPHPQNPIFTPRPGEWDESIIDCYVVFVGGRYLMWYSAFVGELTADTEIAIGLATSEDGFDWQRVGSGPVIGPGAPGSWNDLRVLDGEVLVEDDGSLLMAAYAISTAPPNPDFPDFKPDRLGLWRSAPN